MPMARPPHPGLLVRHDCIEPLGLTVAAAAQALGVTRKTLSELINGRAGISPEMAIRLARAFGSTPEFWLRLQAAYDLRAAEARLKKVRIKRLARPKMRAAE